MPLTKRFANFCFWLMLLKSRFRARGTKFLAHWAALRIIDTKGPADAP
jgi:hypothetical protein